MQMEKTLVVLLGSLWIMSLQAQPEQLIGTTWADGSNAYGCKWVADSHIQFYGASYHCEGQRINVHIEPDGGLTISDKGLSPSMPLKSTMGHEGDTIVYKEIGGHRYLIFYDKGHISDAWEVLRNGESLGQFDSRYETLYGLAGTYLDSATHRKIVFQSDTPIVTGLTAATYYHFGTSYTLIQPLMIFANGQAFYYEPNQANGIDIISVKNFVESPGSWDRGEKLMTLQKVGWVNVSGNPDLPGRYSFGSTRLMIWAVMINFSKAEWRLIRNEIFARYGYRFKSPDLIAYFSAQPWYTPRYDDVSDKLTDLERINIELLNSH
jgi:YARHG domain